MEELKGLFSGERKIILSRNVLILELLYLGYTIQDVALLMNLSRGTVSQIWEEYSQAKDLRVFVKKRGRPSMEFKEKVRFIKRRAPEIFKNFVKDLTHWELSGDKIRMLSIHTLYQKYAPAFSKLGLQVKAKDSFYKLCKAAIEELFGSEEAMLREILPAEIFEKYLKGEYKLVRRKSKGMLI